MGQAIPPITFSDQTIVEIEKTLDLKLSSTRRELLKHMLLEWGRTDLVEHLSRESRPIQRKRVNRVEKSMPANSQRHLARSKMKIGAASSGGGTT